MSFFTLSDNSNAAETGGQFETGGGDIEPIPSGTSVLAAPDECKIDDYNGEQFISIRWVVLQPSNYANRKIFQKVRVFDSDTKKADKAKRMLAAIDTNAGGKLLASGESPSDHSLTVALVNKPMLLKLQVWEIEKEDGSGKMRGNWVSAVAPRNGTQKKEEAKPSAPPVNDLGDAETDDIPF